MADADLDFITLVGSLSTSLITSWYLSITSVLYSLHIVPTTLADLLVVSKFPLNPHCADIHIDTSMLIHSFLITISFFFVTNIRSCPWLFWRQCRSRSRHFVRFLDNNSSGSQSLYGRSDLLLRLISCIPQATQY